MIDFVKLSKSFGLFGPLEWAESHNLNAAFQIFILGIWMFGFMWVWIPIQTLGDIQEAYRE